MIKESMLEDNYSSPNIQFANLKQALWTIKTEMTQSLQEWLLIKWKNPSTHTNEVILQFLRLDECTQNFNIFISYYVSVLPFVSSFLFVYLQYLATFFLSKDQKNRKDQYRTSIHLSYHPCKHSRREAKKIRSSIFELTNLTFQGLPN